MTPDQRLNLETLTRQHDRATRALGACLRELFPRGAAVEWRDARGSCSGISAGVSGVIVFAVEPDGKRVEVEATNILRASATS